MSRSESSKLLPGPIGIVLIPRFTLISFASALESIRLVNRYVVPGVGYEVLSLDGEAVVDGNGIAVPVQGKLGSGTDVGTLLVCADIDPESHMTAEVGQLLRKLAARGVTIGGIDTGAHLLAKAGLLEGRRATLHWENAPAFRERYTAIEVTSNLFEFDRGRVTCAGGTAAIDMMLYAWEQEFGRQVALRVSDHFLHGRIRHGAEQQRLAIPERFGVHHPKVVAAIELMERSIEEPMSGPMLAKKVGVSGRQLLRLFREHLRSSPSRLYLHLRLDHGRRLIIQSDLSVMDIATACGFESASHFSRVYREHFGHAPRKDRRFLGVPESLVMKPGRGRAV